MVEVARGVAVRGQPILQLPLGKRLACSQGHHDAHDRQRSYELLHVGIRGLL